MNCKKTIALGLAMLLTGFAAAQRTTLTDDNLPLTEGMRTQETDSLLKDWTTSHFLIFDENCNTTGENPNFEPEVYASRLHRLPNVVDMPYNDIVRKYIDQYGTRLRRTVSVMLGASNFYNPIFEEALESYQVPLELKYLPIIESALNPKAVSKAGAVGLWQFMIGTGKQYGLEVTSLIDERRDPIKASYAAAHYLKDLYNIFGDWTLVIASYNCGPNNVSKAIKRAGGEKDFWTIYKYLPNETKGYVPAFIAADYMMNYYCDHNICPVNTTLPQGTDTIMVSRDVRLEQIAQRCHIGMDELKALNPQYRTSLIPGDTKPCALRMPSENINAFLEAGDSIYEQPATTPAEATAANSGDAPAVTDATATTEVTEAVEEEDDEPADTRYSKRSKYSKKSRKRERGKSVTIKDGDTLSGIAKRNHTTVEKLKRLNGIKGDNIRAGKSIKVK